MRLIEGDIIEGRICDFASGGEGVMKVDGFAVFIPFAIVGELVRAKVSHVKKDCAFATLVEVVEPSNNRVKPRCPYFGKCGGCDLQHMSYDVQLEVKRKCVESALRKTANAICVVPTPISCNQWEYRNKITLPFTRNSVSGRVSLGFYERRTHKVTPIKWCPLHGEWATKMIEAVTMWANDCGISVYDEHTGKGILRHVVARMLDSFSLTVVINADDLPYADKLIRLLGERFNDFCLYISENRKDTNVIFGDSVKLIYGEEKEQILGGFAAKISPRSFLQVNAEVRDKIYDAVAQSLKNFGGDIVELYSGVGVLTAELAKRLPNSHITSVEIERSAVNDAKALFARLGLENIKVVADDALNYMKSLQICCGEALVLDPPRRGCDREVLEQAIANKFELIIYISCNPQTLARDLATLFKEYELEKLQPYDMFPNTSGVETLAVLKRRL